MSVWNGMIWMELEWEWWVVLNGDGIEWNCVGECVEYVRMGVHVMDVWNRVCVEWEMKEWIEIGSSSVCGVWVDGIGLYMMKMSEIGVNGVLSVWMVVCVLVLSVYCW